MPRNFAPQSQISFLESGAKTPNRPTLLFLHAFPLSSEMWRAQLEEFGRDCHCLTPDFPGFGESAAIQNPSFEKFAAQFSGFLHELEVEKAVVIGLSMGGYAAFELWRQIPKKIAGLVLCDTRADADSDDAKKARDEMHAFALQNPASEVARKMMPKLLGKTTRETNLGVIQKVEEIAAPHASQILADTILALKNRRDSTDLLPQISVPTLVLGGAEDEISNPQIMGEMAAKIPGARHVVIEGAGHLSNLEQPPEFNAALREWLGAQNF